MSIIKEDIFRKQVKSGLSGAYIFYGDEDYLKSHSLKSVIDVVCPDESFAVFNHIKLDATSFSPDALIDALTPLPMMSDKKLVTLDGLNFTALGQRTVDELFEILENFEAEFGHNILVISIPEGMIEVTTSPKYPVRNFDKLSKLATLVCFEEISGEKLTSWVEKHFAHNGVTASRALCKSLIDYSGKSMFTLSSETEKISYYVLSHGRNTVTDADIKEVANPEISADAFALANALSDGRYSDALKVLSVEKFRRVEPIVLMSEVSKVICELMYVKVLSEEGYSIGEISSKLKMGEYKVRLLCASVSSKSKERIKKAIELCSAADIELKRSPKGYQTIENLICSL